MDTLSLNELIIVAYNKKKNEVISNKLYLEVISEIVKQTNQQKSQALVIIFKQLK